jgi:dihydrofolate reductase
MGLLTFGLNVTLDGCIDHTQGIVDDELHDYWTQLMDQSGAMLFGRNTYELMEGAWPAVARDETAPRAMREWARKLEAKAKYVVSGSRTDFPWQNTIRVEGDLREAISALKAKTERGVLVGAPKLSAALEARRRRRRGGRIRCGSAQRDSYRCRRGSRDRAGRLCEGTGHASCSGAAPMWVVARVQPGLLGTRVASVVEPVSVERGA